MKSLLIISFVFLCNSVSAQKLEKIWQTDTVLAIPESVLPDPDSDDLYVSLIDGGGWEADGKGGVALLGKNGQNYRPNWITGLQAPKGMGIYRNLLYVADITAVIVIDRKKGKIIHRITIDSAKGLNDISVNKKGVVFVSDSRTARVWKIEKNKPALFLENMKGVNGLKVVGNDLIVASGKTFLKADASGKTTTILQLPQGGDGIEPIGNGDFLVTGWSGYIFYVHASGKTDTLLETHQQKINAADIGYDSDKKIVYVPTFNGKTVVAYKLTN